MLTRFKTVAVTEKWYSTEKCRNLVLNIEKESQILGYIKLAEQKGFSKTERVKEFIKEARKNIKEEEEQVDSKGIESGWKELYKKDRKNCIYELTKMLIHKHNIISIGDRMLVLYVYDSGYYREGEKDIKKEIQELLEEEGTTHMKNEVVNQIKDLSYINHKEIEDNRDLIPLSNGVYSITEGKLIGYKPENYFFTKLSVNYREGADCPKHKKFFDEILDSDDVVTMQELLGFSLYRKNFIKKAFIFTGEKNTGKSTLIKVISNLFGKENFCGVSLQKLAQDKFSLANLHNKHLNIYDDLDAKGINDTGIFKIATGGGLCSGERKFGEEFQFVSYAKNIFACNKIPDVKEVDDDAYFDRWLIINFSAEIKKVNPFLDEELASEEELSGLFNWAVEGLKRLLDQKKFTNTISSEKTKEVMLKGANSIAGFVVDCLKEGESDFILGEDMYTEYRKYCQFNNFQLKSDKTFQKNINKFAPFANKCKSKLNRKMKEMRGYENVIINSESYNKDISPPPFFPEI